MVEKITVAVYYNPKRDEEFYVDVNAGFLTEDPRYPGEFVYFKGWREI